MKLPYTRLTVYIGQQQHEEDDSFDDARLVGYFTRTVEEETFDHNFMIWINDKQLLIKGYYINELGDELTFMVNDDSENYENKAIRSLQSFLAQNGEFQSIDDIIG